jgi:hypothetical protein
MPAGSCEWLSWKGQLIGVEFLLIVEFLARVPGWTAGATARLGSHRLAPGGFHGYRENRKVLVYGYLRSRSSVAVSG